MLKLFTLLLKQDTESQDKGAEKILNGLRQFDKECKGPLKNLLWMLYHTYLPLRTLEFSGNVTLVKGYGYMSYDMVTEQFRWKHNLDHGLTKCWSYWS